MQGNNKNLWLGAAGLLLLAVLVIGSAVLGSDDPKTEPDPAPSGTATAQASDPGATGTAEPSQSASSTTTASPSKESSTSARGLEVPPEAPALAEKAVHLYTEYSYRDSGPGALFERLSAVSTTGLTRSLHETFSSADDVNAVWSQDVVPTRRETRTEVEKVDLDEVMYQNTAKRMTFAVVYRTAVKSTETDGWTTPNEAMTLWVTVDRGSARWVVSNIEASLDAVR